MLTIEKDLISQGWEVTHRIGKVDFAGYKTPSTMANLFNTYSKGNYRIIIGLNEKGLPPTLIYPRPFYKEKDGYYTEVTDHDVNKWLNSYSLDTLLQNKPIKL
jgi:hypothetical protein